MIYTLLEKTLSDYTVNDIILAQFLYIAVILDVAIYVVGVMSLFVLIKYVCKGNTKGEIKASYLSLISKRNNQLYSPFMYFTFLSIFVVFLVEVWMFSTYTLSSYAYTSKVLELPKDLKYVSLLLSVLLDTILITLLFKWTRKYIEFTDVRDMFYSVKNNGNYLKVLQVTNRYMSKFLFVFPYIYLVIVLHNYTYVLYTLSN